METALIIFIKNPVLGQVKTRLAESFGEEKALDIYTGLLNHTRNITSGLECDNHLFYSDFIDNNDAWDLNIYQKHLQYQSDNLGDRMLKAFEQIFKMGYKKMGYKKVVIIGSDCPELTPNLINQSFSLLNNNNCVLGPANDGGYYLLGMDKLYSEFFINKKWSTSNVLKDTISNINTRDLTYYLLKELIDVDTKEDYLHLV